MLLWLVLTLAAPTQGDLPGPGTVDAFHPDRGSPAEPTRGGRVTLHLASRPRSLNGIIDGTGATRAILFELHESLIRRDPTSGDWTANLAESWEIDDLLARPDGTSVIGRARPEGADAGSFRTKDGEVVAVGGGRVLRGVAYTFRLRDDVRWHDGHAFDAGDVEFSLRCYANPHVPAGKRRYLFEKLAEVSVLDAHTIRCVFEAPYFLATSAFDESLTLLPAHVYDLADEDCPEHDPEAGAERRARFVVEHAANRAWIGLGPYRLASWEGDVLRATRFEDYFDPARGGYLDEVRWRVMGDLGAARQALLSGELDFFDRLSSEDYFGGFTASPEFRERLYAGHYYTPYVGYTAWNTHREHLADPRVRRALAMAFDWDAFIDGFYGGLAFRMTSEQWVAGPNHDPSLRPLPFDLDAARAALSGAGWYDRDGDGRVDRDGAPLVVELLHPAGNETSGAFGLRYQESLARIGVTLELAPLEFSSLRERVVGRDFDAVALGLVLAYESDPEQLWHSRWADVPSGNLSGLADAEVDRRIEAIQAELDPVRRAPLFHALARRIQHLQPYSFGVCAPRRFAMARRIRGVRLLPTDPGYEVRGWYVADVPD